MGHGRAVGCGWARGQPMKSENCLDFVQPESVHWARGGGLLLIKSRLSPEFVQVRFLSRDCLLDMGIWWII